MTYKTFFLDQGETLGGAERFLLDFLGQLSPAEKRQISPVLIGAKHPKYQEKINESIPVIDFNYPSVRASGIKKIIKGFNLFRAALNITQIIRSQQNKRFQPVVWANTPRTIFVGYLAKRFFDLDVRLIIMIHDFTIPKFLLKRIAKCADSIVVNSVLTRQRIRANIRERDQVKMCIIENGIDFSSIPLAVRPKKIEKVVLVGRIDPRKGQKYVAEVADLLLERNPDISFFIIGSPFFSDARTVAYDQEIKKFAADRNLKNVFFIEEVDDPFMAFNKADLVLVLPMEPETFGRVTIEALSQGKMVLAFDQDGPKQVLTTFARFAKATPDLLLSETGNVMTLAEKIGYMADNPDEIDIYTQNARAFTEKYFDFRETKKRLMNLILGK